ncbi:hypothetical protein BkAM31D_10995 [Halalkalibacter krulwichiae]|uniref:Uncharacterized protein n=1 Tax=Halalkalibacter krulwichiae TaxID=199441 RepID=A0A1X9MA22_9BACI|nr:hypothetical protein BkAM31D_10995 [Halalkalibacter krulwichiae]
MGPNFLFFLRLKSADLLQYLNNNEIVLIFRDTNKKSCYNLTHKSDKEKELNWRSRDEILNCW